MKPVRWQNVQFLRETHLTFFCRTYATRAATPTNCLRNKTNAVQNFISKLNHPAKDILKLTRTKRESHASTLVSDETRRRTRCPLTQESSSQGVKETSSAKVTRFSTCTQRMLLHS